MSKILHTNKLLASIAVFAELCNTEHDMRTILTEFIKSIYALEKTFALESQEATNLLKKHYDFDLPEAVVKTCLNSLVSKSVATKNQGKYSLIDQNYSSDHITEKLDAKRLIQEEIENNLIEYCSQGKMLEDAHKKEIIDGFISYLMDNGVTDKHSALISSFVIENSESAKFVSDLNQIKEGLVLITGLTFTSDLNEVGNWDEELTIYLDTEHLFNSAGFNGEVFKNIFDDFYSLVNEINISSQKRMHKKLIHLKYFKNAIDEVDRFFSIAQKIIKREDSASPHNIAMETICNGCESVSDVLRKKAIFETNLKTRGITMQEELDYYNSPEFNIEDSQLLEKYKNKFSEQEVVDTLQNFTKINFLRKGKNRISLEKVKHIMLTGKYVSLVLSKDLEIKNEAKDIPFVTDIYFITNRMWYRLNKGFSRVNNLPATLDIIVKAQIVLSSQVNRSIEKEYSKLKNDVKNGKLNNDEAQSYYYTLREQSKKPEDITVNTVEKSVELIFENHYDKYLKEKSFLMKEIDEGQKAIKELNKINFQKKKKKKAVKKLKAKMTYIFLISLLFIGFTFVIFGLSYSIIIFKTPNDTILSIASIVIGLIIEIFAVLKYYKPVQRKIKMFTNKCYKNSLN